MSFQDFFTKLSDKEKKIFYVAVAVVLMMILDRIFLGPVFSRMKFLDEQIRQQQNIIQRDLRLLSYKDRILKDNKELKKYYGSESRTVEEIIADFLKKLEMMASQSQVNLIKVSPSDSKQKKGYIEYYANLECEGFLENIVNFMHAIDTSEDLLKIIKVSMSLKRASGDEILVGMVVAKMIIDSSGDEFESIDRIENKGSVGGDSRSDGKNEGTSASKYGLSGSGGGSGGASGKSGSSGAGGAGGAGGSNSSESSGEVDGKAVGGGSPAPELSQRFPMSGLQKTKFIPQDEEETGPEIKPSIFENIMKKVKDPKSGTEE